MVFSRMMTVTVFQYSIIAFAKSSVLIPAWLNIILSVFEPGSLYNHLTHNDNIQF